MFNNLYFFIKSLLVFDKCHQPEQIIKDDGYHMFSKSVKISGGKFRMFLQNPQNW